jgi:hypothetical protein
MEDAPVVPKQTVGSVPKSDEEVEVVVSVEVHEGRLTASARTVHPELRGYIGEGPSVIPVQPISDAYGSEADVKVWVAITIVVPPGSCPGFFFISEALLPSDVSEGAEVVSIEPIRPPAKADEQVQISIAIEVGPGVNLRPRGVEDIRLNRSKGGVQFPCVLNTLSRAGKAEDTEKQN